MSTIPKTCPKCLASYEDEKRIVRNQGRFAWFTCGSKWTVDATFRQSILCVARQEIATLKTRAEKAEAERDEARRVAQDFCTVFLPMLKKASVNEQFAKILAALPEWAKEKP